MPGRLITLPLRLSLRATRTALSTGVKASESVIALASNAVRSAGPSSTASKPDAPRATPRQDGAAESTVARATTLIQEPEHGSLAESTNARSVGEHSTAVISEEPAHVSEEPVVVEESAEPGAEDGAGAQVRIAMPWENYNRMTAKDVLARLSDATAAELAAVDLYETVNRRRETVLSAVERELRLKSGSGRSS